MILLNEKIDHIVFGKGMVIGQNGGRLTIQFSEQYGIKQFMYPDAFEKHLRLLKEDLEQSILKELNDKQQKIEAEKLLKLQQREQEELERKKALKKTKDESKHRSRTRKAKTAAAVVNAK